MKKNGFTLVELLAVIVLIAFITMLTFPNLKNLRKNNNEKEFTTYENMMVQYVKAIPNYRNRSYVCLSELSIKKINDKMECFGYVTITSSNSLTPYLSCSEDGTKLYETNNYDSSKCA